MAERPADFPALPAFDDEKYYRVQLWKPVDYGGRRLSPSDLQVMKGDVAKSLVENIHAATEATDHDASNQTT